MINTANTDFIQATIEIFGAIIVTVIGIIFMIMTRTKKRSEKYLFALLLITSASLLFDAGWYMYDGNTTIQGIVINHISNFSIFIINSSMVICASGYYGNILIEDGAKPRNGLLYASYTFSALGLLIPISNLFYKWMYYFDDENIYHRMSGWYIFIILNLLALSMILAMLLTKRKGVSKRERNTLCIIIVLPLIAIIVQIFKLGVSFIQLSLVISALIVLASYFVDLVNNEKRRTGVAENRRNFWIIEGVFLIMILCISAAVVSCVVSVKSISNKSAEQNSLAIGHMVSETVDATLLEPINVAKTMSDTKVIKDALSEKSLEGTDCDKEMISFMKRIKDEYGYQMVFASKESNKAYYTYEGLSRYMDVDDDETDAWYKDFKNQNKRYILNIDADKDNDMSLGVFVNMEVRDESGKFIGVCGVGKSMKELTKILSYYENEYGIKISLVDENGKVQISTNTDQIKNSTIDVSNMNTDSRGDFTYEKNNSKALLTKYMKGFNWYLIIEDSNLERVDVVSIILPSIIIYIIGIVLMIFFALIFSFYDRHRIKELHISRKKAETDGLTGLKNRYAMNRFIKEIELIGIPENFVVIIFDINGLKQANDGIGHDAGDELIRGVANTIHDVFKLHGDAFRIGGDEFVVMCSCDSEELEKLMAEFEKHASEWKGELVEKLTVSVGVASHSEYRDNSIHDLIKMADELMYEDKREFYMTPGNNRRKRYR